jgi:hypothetical protein
VSLPWQPSLLSDDRPTFDGDLTGAVHHELGDGAWYEAAPGWVLGADALFAEVVDAAPWVAHERRMYDEMVVEPRLTTRVWPVP